MHALRRSLVVLSLSTTFTALACAPLNLEQSLSQIAAFYQTTPELMTPVLVVAGDSHGRYLATLETWAEAREITVEWVPGLWREIGLVGATAWPNGRATVYVDSATPKNNQLLTLLHELAHVFHGRALVKSRLVVETIAESTAYEVCRRLGLNTQRESFSYLAQFPIAEREEVLRLFGDKMEQWVDLLTAAAKSGVIEP